MDITGSDYFTKKRAQAAQKKQRGLLGGRQSLTAAQGHQASSSYTKSARKGADRFCQTENREIHTLSNVSTVTTMHPLGDKNVFVGRKTNLSIEKPLSRDD